MYKYKFYFLNLELLIHIPNIINIGIAKIKNPKVMIYSKSYDFNPMIKLT